jgi:hypothetical protein
MARFNAEYSAPTRTATPVSDGARATFQNQEAEQLFTGLGLREGGFQANANRVFMLDDTGKLVTPPPYDANNDHGMSAAAQDGRLYIMDKNFRLRQVRLEGNENDGFAFAATNLLQRDQRPRVSMDYYFRRLSAATEDFVRNTAQLWADMKRDMAEINARWKEDMAEIFGRRTKEPEKAKVKEEEGSLIPEEEPVQTQQTVSAPEAKPEETKEKTVEELLATNPTKQTTPEFERYLNALVTRAGKKPVEQALEKEAGKPEDYYEALAQELEGGIAGMILGAAPKESQPAERAAFLQGRKHLMASISKGLRGFVETKVESALVEDYYKAHAGKKDGLDMQKSIKQMKLESEAMILVGSGAGDYMRSVIAQNAAHTQEMQQSQPQQVQQVQMQAPQQQMQQAQPAPAPVPK